MLNTRNNYTQEQRDDDAARGAAMIGMSLNILNRDITFKKVLEKTTLDEILAEFSETSTTTKPKTTKTAKTTAKVATKAKAKKSNWFNSNY